MEKDILRVSLVQFDPRWEDVGFNLSRLGSMMQALVGKTDLIVLPEMFPTGFSMNTDLICSTELFDETKQWMKQQALSTDAMLVGGMAVKESEKSSERQINNQLNITDYNCQLKCYNRLHWISPDGDGGHYDKHHLFSMSTEPHYYSPGTEKKQFEWNEWQIKPIICYELRFPEWSRNNRINPYDILICIASWPSVRYDVWLTLLKARALENQCYVVGVNRVGTDGYGLHHKGDSIVYSPKGKTIIQLPENEEIIVTVELPLSKMNDFREKFPVLEDIE